jgi:hypothetical protein
VNVCGCCAVPEACRALGGNTRFTQTILLQLVHRSKALGSWVGVGVTLVPGQALLNVVAVSRKCLPLFGLVSPLVSVLQIILLRWRPC